MDQALPTGTRTIGEHEYEVTRLGFHDFRKFLTISEQVLSPGIVALLSGFDAQKAVASILDTDASTIARGLLSVIGGLGSKDSNEIFRILGSNTQVVDEGKKIRLTTKTRDNQDQWWALYPGECLLWLIFCYEVQCRDFFAGPALLLQNLLPGQEINAK